MVEEGALNDPQVDEVYGLHVWNAMQPGQIGVRDGSVMANSDRFFIKVRGQGGHGGQPDATVDPIVVACNLVMSLQTIVSRNTDPIKSAVVTVGTIHGGTAPNVIPEEVSISGTCRSYDKEVQDLIIRRMTEICNGVGIAHNAKIELEYKQGYPAVVNSTLQTQKVANAATKVVGKENIKEPQLIMAAEDFAYYLEEKPGCFFFLGSAPEHSKNYVPHHCDHFDVNEDPTLAIGASVFVQLIDDLLVTNKV